MKAAVRQDCLLPPFFFLLMVDWIVKTSTSQGYPWSQWTACRRKNNLKFADDVTLLFYTKRRSAGEDGQLSNSLCSIRPQHAQRRQQEPKKQFSSGTNERFHVLENCRTVKTVIQKYQYIWTIVYTRYSVSVDRIPTTHYGWENTSFQLKKKLGKNTGSG